MCGCAHSALLLNSSIRIRELGFAPSDWAPRNHAKFSNSCFSHLIFRRIGGSRLTSAETDEFNSTTCVSTIPNRGDLGFKDEGKRNFGFEGGGDGVDLSATSAFDFPGLEEHEGMIGEEGAGNPEDEKLFRVDGGKPIV